MTINETTYEVRGAIYDVYHALGPGLLESVYEEALAFELEQRGLSVRRQQQVPIIYKGNQELPKGMHREHILRMRDMSIGTGLIFLSMYRWMMDLIEE